MALNLKLKVGYASIMPVDSSQAPGTVLSILPQTADPITQITTAVPTAARVLARWSGGGHGYVPPGRT